MSNAVIRTRSGRLFDLLDPRPSMVDFDDIAVALANICRFGGHVARFYSVAEHSVLVSLHAETPQHALAALLHDAAEAYVGDMVSPLKREMPDYAEAERNVWRAICDAFGLDYELPHSVKILDERARILEQRTLQGGHVEQCGLQPLPGFLHCFHPGAAEAAFRDAAHGLGFV